MAANNGFDRIIPKRGTLAQIETAIATLVDYEIAIDKDSSVLTYRLGDEIIPMGAGSSTIRTTQATAGILVNDLMAYDGTDFIVADLLAENPVPVKAIVSKLVDTTAIDGTVDGFILLENMLDSSGGALISNTVYFVDPTNPKKMTATQPTSGWVQPIFQTFLNKGLINGIMLDSPIFNADNRVSTLQVGAGLLLADDVISVDLADDPINKTTPSSVKVVSEKNLADEAVALKESVDNSFGNGQTWQDLQSSRSTNTTYTNDTGKVIMITVSSTPTAWGYIALRLDGIQIQTQQAADIAVAVTGTTCVPAGSTYFVNSNATIQHWFELR